MKLTYTSPIKFSNQKQFPSSAQKPSNESKQVKMSLDVPSHLEHHNTGQRISFSESQCNGPYLKMNDYPLKNSNQKPFLGNKSSLNAEKYRNPLLTP